jgi:glucosylceramidase
MKLKSPILLISVSLMTMNCKNSLPNYDMTVYETAAGQKAMQVIKPLSGSKEGVQIKINTTDQRQTITGIGGAVTESTAYLLTKLGEENRAKVLEAYFGEEGANYSFIRTHINSCDFSLDHYAYAMVPEDFNLDNFDISKEREYIIPIIKQAQSISPDGFKILASPWTAPPWMKDNNSWVGGKLLPKYYDTWALYFTKYIKAYKEADIDIWGITVENEPLGNSNNWESMHFTPKEMTDFVVGHLGPVMDKNKLGNVKILGYDQNRAELKEWVDEMYRDSTSSNYFSGTAIHWYDSTIEYYPEALQYAHAKAPDKYIIQTEACVDSEVPHWQDDDWYWKAEATDWGWDWAPEDKKYLHPKYVPVFRYAKDIIGCFNNHVDGWIDWNMVLDKQGGPNWFKNWCVAPILADIDTDEVYFTPLYYTMMHFSKFIRPNATILGTQCEDEQLMAVTALNPDKSISLVVCNSTDQSKDLTIEIEGKYYHSQIKPLALQTIKFTHH